MTTPDTSAVRAWARDNGFDVADRGRLPAEVVEAYTASRTKAGPAQRTTAAPAAAPSSKPAAAKKPAPTRKAATAKKAPGKAAKAAKATRPAPTARAPKAVPAAAPVDPTEEFADASLEAITVDPPAPHAAAAPADGQLQRLAEQVRALTERVAALETRADAQPEKPLKSRFRRPR